MFCFTKALIQFRFIYRGALKVSTIRRGPGEKYNEFSGKTNSSHLKMDESDLETDSNEPISVLVTEDIDNVLKDALASHNASSLTIEKKIKHMCGFYMELDINEKCVFLCKLARDYNVDHANIEQLCKNYLLQETDRAICIQTLTLENKLKHCLTPHYSWAFSQIGKIEGGVKYLVDMRTDILNILEKTESIQNKIPDIDLVYLRTLNSYLKDLLVLWFSVGFLNLERVTWQSSCDMLQKVSEYEAVHPMRNWTDLKRRVGAYRRCFVFLHSAMPREPIVVLHTALTTEISKNIQSIVVSPRLMSLPGGCLGSMDGSSGPPDEDGKNITTAVFYSIASTQKGLTGIDLGNYLIKRVVKELMSEFPNMQQFSSLSPIPGFNLYLTQTLTKIEKGDQGMQSVFLYEDEFRAVQKLLLVEETDSAKAEMEVVARLKKMLRNNSWFQNEELTKVLQTPLMRLCARYLYIEKRRGFALDSVAHFHLRNGAVMWRLNWKSDISHRGLGNSCSMMVNYRYFLDVTVENSEKYLEDQVINASEQVQQLARQSEMNKSDNAATPDADCEKGL